MPSQHLAEMAFLLRLDESSTWIALNHYKKTPFGFKSEIVPSEFFVSSDGKFNPRKELDDTINGVFNSDRKTRLEYQKRFPARYAWLCDALGELNELENSSEFKIDGRFHNKDVAELLFASASFSEASSTMGHLFIRLRSALDENGVNGECISFEAEVTSSSTAGLIWKGLLGGFWGSYKLSAYHEKSKEYRDRYGRDIYTFKIICSPRDVKLLTYHFQELRGVVFEYDYLKKNCANAMVPLINVLVRHGVCFRAVKPWNAPIDLVRCVVEAKVASIGSVDHSNYSNLKNGYNRLDRDGKEIVLKAIADSEWFANREGGVSAEVANVIALYGSCKYESFDVDDGVFNNLISGASKSSVLNCEDLESQAVVGLGGCSTSAVNLGIAYNDSKFFAQFGIRPAASEFVDTTVFFQ